MTYTAYDQVPWYRRAWVTFSSLLAFPPLALFAVITGDIYYQRSGKLSTYSRANKLLVGILAGLNSIGFALLFILFSVTSISDSKEKSASGISKFNAEKGTEQTPVYPVLFGGLIGLADNHGNVVKPPMFTDAFGTFSDGLLAVKDKSGRWGYVDLSGNSVISGLEVDEPGSFSNGLAAVKKNGKVGYINRKGEWVIQPQFLLGHAFSKDGFALVKPSPKEHVFINNQGRIIAGSYISASPYGFAGGLAAVQVGDSWGYIDTEGRPIIESRFQYASAFQENGLAVIKLDGKYGYIDKKGREIIKATFENAEAFSEGLAAVKVNGKYGYIDNSGQMAIQPLFDAAYSFVNGKAEIKQGKQNFWLDKEGRITTPNSELSRDFKVTVNKNSVTITVPWTYSDEYKNKVLYGATECGIAVLKYRERVTWPSDFEVQCAAQKTREAELRASQRVRERAERQVNTGASLNTSRGCAPMKFVRIESASSGGYEWHKYECSNCQTVSATKFYDGAGKYRFKLVGSAAPGGRDERHDTPGEVARAACGE